MRAKVGRKSLNVGVDMEVYENIKIISAMNLDRSINSTINKAIASYIEQNKSLIEHYKKA